MSRLILAIAVAILVLCASPTPSSAMSWQAERLIKIVADFDSVALVRATTEPSRAWNGTVSVEVLEPADPPMDVPPQVTTMGYLRAGTILLATRFRGRWSASPEINAGRRNWHTSELTTAQILAAVRQIRAFRAAVGDDARRHEIRTMLRSKNVLIRGAAIDLVTQQPEVWDEKTFQVLTSSITCTDPVAGAALDELSMHAPERNLDGLRRLLSCHDQEMVRRVHALFERFCPLDLERARARATTGTEFRAYEACRKQRIADWEKQRRRRYPLR